MSKRQKKAQQQKLEDVMRAAWFARLALGVHSDETPAVQPDTSNNERFIKRVIDLER